MENINLNQNSKINSYQRSSTSSIMESAETKSEVLGLSVIALNLGMYIGLPAIVIVGIRKKSKN